MKPGARTPEELETLLEDAFVLRDGDAVAALFERDAVLAAQGRASLEVKVGRPQISVATAALWERDLTYLAAPLRVLQARDTALVVGTSGINVARRASDGRWRYAISLLDIDPSTDRETP